MYLVSVFPLNAPPSVARRLDCIHPIAYVYPGSDVVDVFRVLLPQMHALRDVPRTYASTGTNVRYVVEFHLLVGDFPAVSRALMTMMSTSAAKPCIDCDCPRNELNDPDKWSLYPTLTQRECQSRISRMRRNPEYTQKESGMNDSNREHSNPLFEYFGGFGDDCLDAISLRGMDQMHEAFLGVLQEIGKAFAAIIQGDHLAKKKFQQVAKALYDQRLKELTITLWRPKNLASETKTDLLGLLESGQFYARELQELWPLFGILFGTCGCERGKKLS